MSDMGGQHYGATTTVERTSGWPGALHRVSWGAVMAGVVIATALQIVLSVLGAAIGLTALEGDDSAKAFGIGAGIWALLVPLVTLFLGGRTAAYLAGARDKGDAFLHGALVWGVSLLLAAWLLGSGASRLLGSSLNLAGNVAGGAASAAGSVASRADVNTNDVAALDDRARAEAAERGVTEQDARGKADSVQATAGRVADKAQGVAAGGAWLALLALGLALAAAVMGARSAYRHDDHARVTTTTSGPTVRTV